MTHASLFSGIGGFDLAAEWAGWTNVFNCEIDPFCRKVLKFHFPKAAQYEDIRTTDFTVWRDRIDVLTGGLPCQPFSVAGKRKGTGDDRYLWPEMLGAIGRFVPAGSWAKTFPELLIGRRDWFSSRCVLTWKMRATKSNRSYFRLAVSTLPIAGTGCGLLPTVQTQGLKVCVEGKTVFMPMQLLHTPTANDARNVSLPPSQAKRDGGMVKMAMRSDEYRTGSGSRLNPLFIAEMMGFPVDWTALPFQVGAGNPSKPTATP